MQKVVLTREKFLDEINGIQGMHGWTKEFLQGVVNAHVTGTQLKPIQYSQFELLKKIQEVVLGRKPFRIVNDSEGFRLVEI
ncbi:MAG: hypothetical protein ABIE43_05365 [Patescibacteria group bacterium]